MAFGPFVLDRSQRVLLRDGQIVRLTPKTFDLLDLLGSRAGEVVSKQELIDALVRVLFLKRKMEFAQALEEIDRVLAKLRPDTPRPASMCAMSKT